MWLKLLASNRQLYLEDVLCKPHGNYKAIIYRRHTKDKEKGIKAHDKGKPPIHKGTQQERKIGAWELQSSQKTIDKIALVSFYLPINTLNANGLNSSIKRHTVSKRLKQQQQSQTTK